MHGGAAAGRSSVSVWISAFRQSVDQAPAAALQLAALALLFFALAVALRGLPGATRGGRSAIEDTRVNAILSAVDQLTTAPLLGVISATVGAAMASGLGLIGGAVAAAFGLHVTAAVVWALIGPVPTVLIIVFLGDLIGYWRHRAQHSRWLWPAHAIHHSDTTLTWFSLERMHPIDRIGSLFDTLILAALGFPAWALAANVMIRHFYGYMIHADVPWTLGKANWLFNSPAMHRWHHARDIKYSGRNFATVFSVFDRLFGTYHQPGPCDVPLGVEEDMGRGAIGQYLYPLKVWLGAVRIEPSATPADMSPTARF
jgi:sterol desaturase/sphingolipid hydroxylase (fatty acid hydroxylase superfamily)